jgi:glucoamylase
VWRRFNRDGYGQRDNGEPYQAWGRGRAWPLLTGERGHYELAAGRDPAPFIQTLERLATPAGLLPEQVWDGPGLPQAGMRCGGPTGSAVPLVWAHAEYIKLLRSSRDNRCFDALPEVAGRYAGRSADTSWIAMWTFAARPAPSAAARHCASLRVKHSLCTGAMTVGP